MITLNVNGLTAPTKRHRLAEWIQKQDTYICCLQETHFRPKDTNRTKVKGRRRIYHVNTHQKKSRVAVLISDSTFQSKEYNQEFFNGHFTMIRGLSYQEFIYSGTILVV